MNFLPLNAIKSLSQTFRTRSLFIGKSSFHAVLITGLVCTSLPKAYAVENSQSRWEHIKSKMVSFLGGSTDGLSDILKKSTPSGNHPITARYCAAIVMGGKPALDAELPKTIQDILKTYGEKPSDFVNTRPSLDFAKSSFRLSQAVKALALSKLNSAEARLPYPAEIQVAAHDYIQSLGYWNGSPETGEKGLKNVLLNLANLVSALEQGRTNTTVENGSPVLTTTGGLASIPSDLAQSKEMLNSWTPENLFSYIHKYGKHIESHVQLVELLSLMAQGQTPDHLLTAPTQSLHSDSGHRMFAHIQEQLSPDARSRITLTEMDFINSITKPFAEAILREMGLISASEALSPNAWRKLRTQLDNIIQLGEYDLLKPYFLEDDLMRSHQIKILREFKMMGHIASAIVRTRIALSYLPVHLRGPVGKFLSFITQKLESDTARLIRIYKDLPELATLWATKNLNAYARAKGLWDYYSSSKNLEALVSLARVEEFRGIWLDVLKVAEMESTANPTDASLKDRLTIFKQIEERASNFRKLELENAPKFSDFSGKDSKKENSIQGVQETQERSIIAKGALRLWELTLVASLASSVMMLVAFFLFISDDFDLQKMAIEYLAPFFAQSFFESPEEYENFLKNIHQSKDMHELRDIIFRYGTGQTASSFYGQFENPRLPTEPDLPDALPSSN